MSRSTSLRQSARTSAKRCFGVETLEGRELMAGNVNVALSSGNLTITGDAQANGVEVRQISTNKFAVVGLKQGPATSGSINTTINGAGFKIFSGVTGNVTFNMNGGNDQVHISDGKGLFASQPGLPTTFQPVTFAKNVTVNLGDGADTYVADEMTVNGKLKIDGGNGATTDVIKLDEVLAKAIGSSSQALEIDSNGGNDDIDILFSEFRGLVDIDLGTENDTLDLQFVDVVNSADLVIRGQNGNDTIRLLAVEVADDLLIDAGNGDDLVAAVEVTAQDEIDILMGFGTDKLQIFSLIAADADLDGGPGTDTLEDAGENVFGIVDIDNFEVILDVSE